MKKVNKKNIFGFCCIIICFLLIGCAGQCTLKSSPVGAEIYRCNLDSLVNIANGSSVQFSMEYIGLTPFKVSTEQYVKNQFYQARLKGFENSDIIPNSLLKNYPEFIFSLEAAKGDTLNHELLTPPVEKGVNFGYLRVSANVPDVKLYCSGKMLGTIQSEPIIKKLPIGVYNLVAQKSYYERNSKNLTIINNEVSTIHFNLVKSTGWVPRTDEMDIVQESGSLSLVTMHPTFEVILEGTKLTPPITLDKVPAGEYDLIVNNKEFHTIIKIIISSNENTFVDLDSIIK